jgi:RHS repeat-associated protein
LQSQTTYIGSLYEITSEVGSSISEVRKKHIFAGANRIATIELQSSNPEPRIYYYHSDHLGSSSVITDSTGAQVSHYEYTPYGSLAQAEGTDTVKHKFTGKELDSTGLYFYGARYYDPTIGRFITADPTIQRPYDSQDLNRYSYCRNNPINYTDPSGLGWRSFWKKFGGYFGLAGSFINAINTGDWNQFGRMAMITAAAMFAAAVASWAIAPMISGLSGSMAASGAGVTFGEGFILGGMELGIPAFAGTLAGGLAGGEKFSTALKNAAIVGGATFVTGGLIEGSYSAGWQDKIHFNDTRASERNQYNKYLEKVEQPKQML